MVQSPWLNHAWSVTLYVTPTGRATGTVPDGREAFELEFDVLEDALRPTGVARFRDCVMRMMTDVGMPLKIRT